MSVYKCKMCENDLDAEIGQSLCTCRFCGTSQTLPTSVSDQAIAMLSRGNHLRQLCEFDRATAIYEKLLDHIHHDPEIYWQLALCRYGVRYVEEMQADIMIPECRRARYKSILCDPSFLEAVNMSDMLRRDAYRKEAEYIDVMQKKLLSNAAQQEPFDIFLCSMETDSHNKQSPDCLFAREIYAALTEKGYRVFFPPVTLTEYNDHDREACIFAALNSVGVMVAAAVKPENINSLQVRDQWTRFSKLIDYDSSRRLIPVVKDMKLRNLPKGLSGLPGHEVSSAGDLKKLIINIENVLGQPTKSETSEENQLTAEDLVRRGNLCLEKRKWAAAERYFNHAISLSPQEPTPYLGKLLIECELEDTGKIPDLGCDLSFSNNYRTALRLGCTELEDLGRQSILNRGTQIMESARSIEDLMAARDIFSHARGNKNAEIMLAECSRRIESFKENDYQIACRILTNSLSIKETETARDIFISLENYKDSPLKVRECTDLLLRNDYAHEEAYRKAISLMSSAEFHSDYDNAALIFTNLGAYKNSRKLLKKCHKKRMLLSLSIVVKLMFIAGVCYAVPRLIDKI